jgi:cytidine deaminase
VSPSQLVEEARKAALGSYSPYSGFRVGAVVETVDGVIFGSANVENAAYPVSQCAEANAVNFAVSQGARKIRTVAVSCIDATSLDLAYPCGRCRQIMSEFDVETVLVSTGEGPFRTHTLDELIPHRFSF